MFSDSAKTSDSSSQVSTTKSTPTPTPIPPDMCTPSPTPDYDKEAHAEAVATASEHGLTEESLKGKYALFLRFAETIDGNTKLNGYEDIVYALFPMIANQLNPEREGHILARLRTLSINIGDMNMGLVGEYYQSQNYVNMNRKYKYATHLSYTASLFHELVHFTDTNIDGEIESVRFCENGVFPQLDPEGAILSGRDRVHSGSFIKEGGAELYTAKYFSKATHAYTSTVQFFTGFEHIFGSETLDDIFFSHDSAYLFAKLLADNGFTNDEIWNFYETMDSITYNTQPPTQYLRPEDVLIRLYVNTIGPDYLDDAIFCHILRCIYDSYYPFDLIPSAYEAELEGLQKDSSWALNWFYSIVADLPDLPPLSINDTPLRGIYLDGKYYLTALATVQISDQESLYLQALIVDYDFDAWHARSFEIYDIPNVLDM